MLGRTPNSPGPFYLSATGDERAGRGADEVLASGPIGSGLRRDDTSGSPASQDGEACGVSLSIISGGRSPEDEPY